MKHAVRHTWLLHRLCTSRHILARVYHVHGKNCRSLWKSLNSSVRPCSCLQNINSSCISFWSTTTQTLKAEGRLTRLWIHLIVVQNNLLSGVSRLVVPSHQLPIHQLKGEKKQRDAFQFFSSFPNIVFHILLAAGSIKLSAIMYGVLVWATRNATW